MGLICPLAPVSLQEEIAVMESRIRAAELEALSEERLQDYLRREQREVSGIESGVSGEMSGALLFGQC